MNGVAMFRGVSNINIDAKGRIAIPGRYREFVSQHCKGAMVVTIDTEEQCLLIYPLPEWETLQTAINQLSGFKPGVRRVQRLLIGHATDIQLDASGRLQLTPPLREFAGLEKKTVMLGQGNKFELWAEDLWADRRNDWLTEDNSAMSEQLEGISL